VAVDARDADYGDRHAAITRVHADADAQLPSDSSSSGVSSTWPLVESSSR
jgi:hypothetical protein